MFPTLETPALSQLCFQLPVKPGKDMPDVMILQVVLAAASPVPA